MIRLMDSPLSPRLSISPMILYMALMRVADMREISPLETSLRKVAISNSILSVISSYLTSLAMRASRFSASFSLMVSRTWTKPLWHTSPKWMISCLAASSDSSAVERGPPVMYLRCVSSLVSFDGKIMQQSFTICGMNQTRMVVFTTLKRVCMVQTLYSREVWMASALATSVRSAVLGSGRPKRVTAPPTSLRKSGKMHSTQATPKVFMSIPCSFIML